MKQFTIKSLIIFAFIAVIIISAYLFIKRENSKTNSQVPFSVEQLNCSQLEQESKSIVKGYNYCDKDQDCEVVDDYVYDCYFLANKNADTSKVDIIQKTAIEKQCLLPVFDCYTVHLKAKCKNNKCIIAE